jgi:hypothetical protein
VEQPGIGGISRLPVLGLMAMLLGCEPTSAVGSLRAEALDSNQWCGLAGAPGVQVSPPPAVIVRDAQKRPVRGVEVKFQVAQGDGRITGDTVKTDRSGVARVGSWELAAGRNVLAAIVTGDSVVGNPIIFTASAGPPGFNIDFYFTGGASPILQRALETAAARWQAVLGTAEGHSVVSLPRGQCGNTIELANRCVDDVLIFVDVMTVDGIGGQLAAAGPCITRTPRSGPIIGVLRFDAADIGGLEDRGLLDVTALHEMGHVLGLGTLWASNAFLKNPSLPSSPGADTIFSGSQAIAAFDGVGGASYTSGAKVPVENQAGSTGTRDSHWRESVFDNELMTGFIDLGANPLSRVTIASFGDLGYQVDLSAADDYLLPAVRPPGFAVARSAGPKDPAHGVDLGDDVLRLPLHVVDPTGRTFPIGEP